MKLLDITKPLGFEDGRKARYVGVGLERWPIVAVFKSPVRDAYVIQQYDIYGRSRDGTQNIINVVDEMEQEDWS